MKIKTLLPLFAVVFSMASCTVYPKTAFDAAKVPPAPDYARLENWAAHPDKSDPADRSPHPDVPNLQKDAPVDVIFLHPTTYTGDLRHQRDWNASVQDQKTNLKTDNGSILFQGSIFNGTGQVYAPRYRQAHLHTFLTKKDTSAARKALEIAHIDARAAFKYYLENWNNGRPFILVGHSQGGYLAAALIREMIEGTSLESQLVAAYIVGWPVRARDFKSLKPCLTAEQTDCYCTWRTWERKSGRRRAYEQDVICTNPLLWSITENLYAPKTLNLGGVIRPFEKIYPQITDAEVHKGILLASKPKFKGSLFFTQKNYHPGDLNLYYLNVRENVATRAKTYFRR